MSGETTKTRDEPGYEETGLDGVFKISAPVVTYNDSILVEPHREGWHGLYEGPVGHLYWIVTSKGVRRKWGKHAFTTDRYSAVLGVIEVALSDDRPESPTRGDLVVVRLDAALGEGLLIPPGVWHTFRAISDEVVLLNSKNPPYRSQGIDKELLPMPNEHFDFDWD